MLPEIEEIKLGKSGVVSGPSELVQYDKNSVTWRIYLLDAQNNVKPIPEGLTAKLQATKNDAKIVFSDCIIEGNAIVYTVEESLTTTPGVVRCAIGLYEPNPSGDKTKDKEKETTTFYVTVKPSSMNKKTAQSSHEFNTLTVMINTITGLVDTTEKTLEQISEAIDNAKTSVITANELSQSVSISESTRVSNENTRISAEVQRILNENARISEENLRISSETERANAESNRINTETLRSSAETNRVNSEASRNSTETIRISSESTRVLNENQRISNETIRQQAASNLSSITNSANIAKVNAETAAVNANTAANNATKAESNADAAAVRANQAAQAAEDIVSGVISLPDIGTPGTYSHVTTDTKGRVISGINSDTLAGNGITDAYTKSEVNNIAGNKLNTTGDSKDNTVTFTEATSDTDIASGDSHATLFGKLSKRLHVIKDALLTKLNIGDDYRPNKLVNGDFQVWKKGTTFDRTSTPGIFYGPDRWGFYRGNAIAGMVVKKINNGLTILNPDVTAYSIMSYTLEKGDAISLRGKILTMSIKIKSSVANSACSLNATYSNTGEITHGGASTGGIASKPITVGTDFAIYSVTMTVPTDSLGLDIYVFMPSIVATYTIEYVKIEVNDHATPFIPRNYGEELELCQRYCETCNPWITSVAVANDYLVGFRFKTKKRINSPTVTINSTNGASGKVTEWTTATDVAVSSVTAYEDGAITIYAPGAVAGKYYNFYYLVDAEI